MSQITATPNSLSPSLPHVESTIGAAIRSHAVIRPRQAAIVAPDFPPYSYGELAVHIDLIGSALRVAGLDRSSRIAIMLPSGAELALIGVAVAANAIAVPCNPGLREDQFRQLKERLSLDAVILPAWLDAPEWLGSAGGDLKILRIAKAGDTLAGALIEGDTVNGTTSNAKPDDPALILQTSGTIGPPKLVPVSHRNLMAMAGRMQQCFELSHLDRCACLLPLYYAQGIKSGCIVPLLLGGSIAIPRAPVLDTIETWLSQLQPTWFPAGPTFLQAVLDRARSSTRPLDHNLRFLISGSASLPEQVRAGIETAMGIPVLDAWGMTEIGLLTGNSIRPAERKLGTVGYASPDEVAIAAPAGSLLTNGEVGEVVVRGPAVHSGYIADDDANRTAFVNGWFHTGDLGSIDSDGYLTITGRIKEIINRGGEKISPDFVERAFRQHPDVLEAAAFAVPHARLGEDVAAAVVLKPGASPSAAELQNFLSKTLPHPAIPRSIFFLPVLPKGPTGKVLRKELSVTCRPPERAFAAPETEIETTFLTLWRRLLKRDDIGVEDDFFEAGGDSLLAAQMLLETERSTRKLLRGRALPVPATIRAFASGIAGAAPLGDDALVVPVAGGRSQTPFFYCHGDYMFGGRYAYKLAELLGDDFPVYLLNNYNLASLRAGQSIEELAKGYLPGILAAQPSGVLRLGGHCNGGLMAMELSRQLSRMGRDVELVVLIEPISLNARPVFRGIGYMLGALCSLVPHQKTRRSLRAAVMFQFWRAFRWTCERIGLNSPSEDDPATWAEEPRETRKTYQRLMANYTPPRLAARIACLTARGSSRAVEFDWKPWRRLSPAVTAQVIPGNHISCLTTHVGHLAASMRQALSPIGQEATHE
ncbi:MAG TPA: AMP-binding protein [Bryobacteraceae bacterium]|nr:AMP-binding protein [Bryobacteraceae bacterium]